MKTGSLWIAIVVSVLALLLLIATYGLIAYVVWHFASKWW